MPLQQFDERLPLRAWWMFDDTYVPPATVNESYAGASDGHSDNRLDVMLGYNSDSVDHELRIFGDATGLRIATITLPAGAGFSVPAVNILSTLFDAANQFWIGIGGWDITMALAVAPGSGTRVYVWGRGGAF